MLCQTVYFWNFPLSIFSLQMTVVKLNDGEWSETVAEGGPLCNQAFVLSEVKQYDTCSISPE